MTLARMFLSFNNLEEVFEFPVLPEEITILEKSNNSNHVLQNIGEMTVINTSNQPTLKFEGFFPLHHGPYVISEAQLDPVEYIEKMKKWRDSHKPMRITISDVAFPITWPCTIESLEYKEVGGEVGDILYKVEFKEYRWVKVKKIELPKETSGSVVKAKVKEDRPSEKPIPKTYKVRPGDDLYSICKTQLGDGNKYKEVAKKNGIANPNVIYAGQVLEL